MRLIEILPDYEVKRLSRTPILSVDDRKQYFKLDETITELIKGVRDANIKIGLLLSYGYFKISGKFYSQKIFTAADIKMAAKILGVTASKDFTAKYSDRTRQKHRLLILDRCGYLEFSKSEDLFESIVKDLVTNQMHPRKLFYVLVETLLNKKIELPSYDRIARAITKEFNAFEKTALIAIENTITSVQKEALDQLTSTTGDYYQRPLLTRLKTITQSMRPAKIKHGMHNFLIIKKLFKEIQFLVESLSLSIEATKYYAQWVIKAKVTQITEMVEPHKRYLYLVAFISHCHKIWQDTLVDMLLRCVTQQLNKAEKELDSVIKARNPEKNKLVASVVLGFQQSRATIDDVRKVLHNKALNNDEKVCKLYTIVPDISTPSLIKATIDAEKLKSQLSHEEAQGDEFDILTTLSKKLQNRVAEIIRCLEFTTDNKTDTLYLAILHYQLEKNITATAPDAFLEDHEYKAVHKNDKFNVSLYKAILFCKVANAIKSGTINLLHSYRYLSIDAYLIDEEEWRSNKTTLLEKLGLSQFSNVEQLLSALNSRLDQQYIDVNKRIVCGKNKYVKIKKDGSFSLYTPAIEKPDYDSISTIIGKDRYVPILQMMEEMNILSKFTSSFKHHKVKGSKANPGSATFYAGIFALGSNIGLHKLANTALGINYNTLSNTVNWYFSLENLHIVNQTLINLMTKLWLPNKFRREKNLLHTSSDGQKQCVSVESLNANYSYKYHGNGNGASVYRFTDERGILFYSTVFSSSERDAIYVIDGLL